MLATTYEGRPPAPPAIKLATSPWSLRIHSRHHRAKVSRHATTVKMTKPIVMNPHLGCPSSAARQVAAESVMNTQTPRAVVIASALESIRKAICAWRMDHMAGARSVGQL